jgi:ankyrin repeat protein
MERNSRGLTPLLIAVGSGKYWIVSTLVNARQTSVNSEVDERGAAALHIAVEYASSAPGLTAFKMVRILLDNGANPDLLDRNGESPISYAVRAGHESLANVLLDKRGFY